MGEIFGKQVLGMGLLALIALSPAVIAGWFLQRRKTKARQLRRSPLTTDLLRAPGFALREKLEELRIDIAFDVAALLFIPVFPLSFLYVWQVVGGQPASIGMIGLLSILVVGVVAFQIQSLLRRGVEVDKLRLGHDAELAAGQELDQLMRQGAVVFHDLPAEKFNIDHVVIAPQGVFAIETKGYSKPVRDGGAADATVVFDGKTLAFPGWSTSKPLEQAERQSRWLAHWLTSATGQRVEVTPAVVLPGWYVDRKGRGSVHVLNGKELQKNLLKVRGATAVDAEQMQRIVHQVEQRCRSAPLYRPDEG